MNTPLDVHGLSLEEAIKVITKNINICYTNGISVLVVNHGFNKGQKIKKWCLNKGKELQNVVDVKPGENEGITHFYIKVSIY